MAHALLLGGCVHIPSTDDPGVANGYPIEEVVLEGASAVDPATLANGLANRPPDAFLFFSKTYFRYDELQVELDRRRIRSFYERKGFFGVEVEGPELVRVGPKKSRWRVIWKVREGRPARVEAVEIEGSPPGLEERLRVAADIELGEVYETASFDGAKERLRAVLVRQGHARALVDGRVLVDPRAGRARVVFDLQPGPLIRMEDLIAVGTVRTPTSAVLVRRTWERGSVYDPVVLERLRGHLYEIDQYSGVRLDFAESDPTKDRTDVVARVEEAEQNELQAGVGGGFDRTNIYARLRGRYKRRSFPFDLTNTIVEITPGVQFLAQGGFGEPQFTPQGRLTVVWYDFLFPRLELESDVGFQYQQLEAYEWYGPDVGQTLSRPLLDDRLRPGIGWRFHQFGYQDARVLGPGESLFGFGTTADGDSPQERLAITRGQSVVILTPSIAWEGRDDLLEPSRGIYARLALDLGLATNAESAGFVSIHPEVRGYLPLAGHRLVLAARVNLVSNLQGQLPAPQRVYAGGASSQRGFPQRRLSRDEILLDRPEEGETQRYPFFDEGRPDRAGSCTQEAREGVLSAACGEDVVRIPIGGETLLEVNLELRAKLFRVFGFWFGMVAFLDGADLGDRLADLEIPNLHYAAGLGLRYLTPIGAVRADFGYRLNRTGAGEPFACEGRGGFVPCGNFHFSLGQAF